TLFLYILPPHPRPTLFPYTTLFRSVTSSAFSPSFRCAIILTFDGFLSPKPFSGGTSTVSLSPLFALARASSRPLKTHPSPIDTRDRKSTRLNSSHDQISYAVFCLKK